MASRSVVRETPKWLAEIALGGEAVALGRLSVADHREDRIANLIGDFAAFDGFPRVDDEPLSPPSWAEVVWVETPTLMVGVSTAGAVSGSRRAPGGGASARIERLYGRTSHRV